MLGVSLHLSARKDASIYNILTPSIGLYVWGPLEKYPQQRSSTRERDSQGAALGLKIEKE